MVEKKNELIQLAPFYETKSSVRKYLSGGQISIDVNWGENEKSLIIVDSLKKYFANESLESVMIRIKN